MDSVKQWALGVCATAIFSSVIYAVAPKGNMQKVMRCVVSLSVVCSMVLPLVGAAVKLDLDTDLPKGTAEISDSLKDEVNYRLTAAYADEINAQVQELLTLSGYPECETDFLTDIDEDGCIYIKKANIILPEDAVLSENTVEKLYALFSENTVVDIRCRSDNR